MSRLTLDLTTVSHICPDVAYNVEIDDCEVDKPFFSTNSADLPDVVTDIPGRDTVMGHIIMNQVAHCLTREGKNMNITHFEKHFIQNQVSTTPNKATPLTYPEAAMFPRIFWAESRQSPQSILGAIPLWAVGPGCRKFGFPDPAETTRTCLKGTGMTQTCKYYVRHRHDVLANIALSKGHSRTANQHGFQVDTKSHAGLSVNNENDGTLNESIDSHYMVLGLCHRPLFYFGR